jgi:hypothetical protein
MGNAPVLLPERGVAGDEVSGSVTAVGGRGVGERGCASAERVGQRPQVAVGVRERRRTQRSRVLRTSNIRDGIRGFSRFLCAPPSAQAFLKPWRYRWARRQESALWHSHRAGCSHAVRGRGMSSDWFLCGDPGQHGLVGRVDLLSVEPAGPARGTGRPRLRSLLGLLLFFGDHCDFGTAVHGAIPTFFWLALLMLTYPAALHGLLLALLPMQPGADAGAAISTTSTGPLNLVRVVGHPGFQPIRVKTSLQRTKC